MSNKHVTPEQVDDFVESLKNMGLSTRNFCRTLAEEEFDLTDDEIKTEAEKWRQRIKRKSISVFEFQIMLDILEKQPNFKSSNLIRIARDKKTFTNQNFQKSLVSAFSSLK